MDLTQILLSAIPGVLMAGIAWGAMSVRVTRTEKDIELKASRESASVIEKALDKKASAESLQHLEDKLDDIKAMLERLLTAREQTGPNPRVRP